MKVLEAGGLPQRTFYDLDERKIRDRLIGFVAMSHHPSEPDARRVLSHLHREPAFARAGTPCKHKERSVARKSAIDHGSDRSAFGVASHERAALNGREWRNLEHDRQRRYT